MGCSFENTFVLETGVKSTIDNPLMNEEEDVKLSLSRHNPTYEDLEE